MRAWRRLGLMARLTLACSAVLAVLSCVLVYNFVRTEVDLRSREFTGRLDSKLVTLATALTGPAILGDYTGVAELLGAFARESAIESIEWTPLRGRSVIVHGPDVGLVAPAWFEAAIGFPAYASSRRIVVGGTDYGLVSLQLDPRPQINSIWLQVVGTAVTALVGIAAMLLLMLLTVEHGLRSLSRLVSGVRRFEGGDFGVRVEPVGPPEIVSSVVAFNRMAERVGAVFDALRESEGRNRRLAMIVEQSNESILTRDLQGRITVGQGRRAAVRLDGGRGDRQDDARPAWQ